MEFSINQEIISWALILGASLCAYMIGRDHKSTRHDLVIESAIEFLVDGGYIKTEINEDGDLEIIKLSAEVLAAKDTC